MLIATLYSSTLVATTIAIHACGTAWWVSHLQRLRERTAEQVSFARLLDVLLRTAFVLLGLHLVEMAIWALAYHLLPITEISSFEEAVYFSVVTFTTVGYGDVTLTAPWRTLAGVEALSGILVLGWSTALSFAVLQTLLHGNTPTHSSGPP